MRIRTAEQYRERYRVRGERQCPGVRLSDMHDAGLANDAARGRKPDHRSRAVDIRTLTRDVRLYRYLGGIVEVNQ